MRIADKMAFDQVRTNVGKNRTEMSDLQNQAATQKRLTKPSVDPVAAARVLATRTEISGQQQFVKTIQQARSFLEYSEQSLSELTGVMNRAKELAISQSSDASASSSTRDVAAAEVQQLYSQTVQIGNRKLGDRFLFGGFRTTRAPFDPQGNYKGDDGEMKIAINKDAHVAMNLPGSQVFLGRDIQTPLTAGPSGDEQHSQSDPLHFEQLQIKGEIPKSLEPVHDDETLIRGPAALSVNRPEGFSEEDSWQSKGANVFKVLSGLEIALKSNDKQGVQESMDAIDDAMAQIVIARSTLGSRINTLNNTMEAHQKGQVDAKGMASQLEDADAFELVSDINRSESSLKATLETSGKLIQPSLLDFLK